MGFNKYAQPIKTTYLAAANEVREDIEERTDQCSRRATDHSAHIDSTTHIRGMHNTKHVAQLCVHDIIRVALSLVHQCHYTNQFNQSE